MKTPNKPTLFDNDNDDDDDQVTPSAHDWRKEWKGMPEFVQERQKPYCMINIRFANNRLILKQGIKIPEGINEYGMILKPKLQASAVNVIEKEMTQ